MAGYNLENCVMKIKLNFNMLFEWINSKMLPVIKTHICMEPLDVICILHESIVVGRMKEVMKSSAKDPWHDSVPVITLTMGITFYPIHVIWN